MKNAYQTFSGLRFLGSNYTMKFLFIAFLGVHIPLILLIVAITFDWIVLTQWNVILVTLLATLIATSITLLLLRDLLWPIHQAKNALLDFTEKGKVPNLPKNYPDEAGQLLKQVQITIDSLDNLIKIRKDILSLLSHDMRTPYTQLHNIGQILQQKPEAGTVSSLGALIQKTADDQLHFLHDILTILQLEDSEKLFDVYEEQALDILIKKAIEIQSTPASRKDIHIELLEIAPVNIKYHYRLLSQALSNIIGNAIKFSYKGGLITIKTHVFSGYVHIQVSDNGIGFEPGKAEQLFQKFTNAGQKGTEGEASSGLGLYLTRKIIQNHQGKIAAFSDGPGKGAVFTIQLPIAD